MQTFPNDTLTNIPADFWSIQVSDIDGNAKTLNDYKGSKAYLVVNVASECGLTKSNYTELTEIYNNLGSQGLEILAFPCNQFGAQEPSCDADIKTFAQGYGAQYKLFTKIEVNGDNTHPLYRFLRANSSLQQEDGSTKAITWNFEKFLVDEAGNVVKNYHPKVTPKTIAEEVAPQLA